MEECGEDTLLPFLVQNLPSKFIAIAEKDLKETEDKKEKGLNHLRDYLKRKDLPQELSDEFLLRFLRVAKYNLKKSEEKLLNYCTVRRKRAHEYIERLDEDLVRKILEERIMGILPHRDKLGRAIIYGLPANWSPEFCEMDELLYCGFALTEFALSIPATSVCGVRALVSGQVKQYTHYFHYMDCIRKHLYNYLSIPIRLQKVDGIQVDSVSRFLFSVIRPLVPRKIEKRIALHKDGISDETCPSSIIPFDLEGSMENVKNDHFIEEFILFIRKIKNENKLFLK